jgi:hypothetical protein
MKELKIKMSPRLGGKIYNGVKGTVLSKKKRTFLFLKLGRMIMERKIELQTHYRKIRFICYIFIYHLQL